MPPAALFVGALHSALSIDRHEQALDAVLKQEGLADLVD